MNMKNAVNPRKLFVASSGVNRWVGFNYGTEQNQNIQPLVFFRGDMTKGIVEPFTFDNYTISEPDSLGFRVETGDYRALGRVQVEKGTKRYSSEALAIQCVKYVFNVVAERLALDDGDHPKEEFLRRFQEYIVTDEYSYDGCTSSSYYCLLNRYILDRKKYVTGFKVTITNPAFNSHFPVIKFVTYDEDPDFDSNDIESDIVCPWAGKMYNGANPAEKHNFFKELIDKFYAACYH